MVFEALIVGAGCGSLVVPKILEKRPVEAPLFDVEVAEATTTGGGDSCITGLIGAFFKLDVCDVKDWGLEGIVWVWFWVRLFWGFDGLFEDLFASAAIPDCGKTPVGLRVTWLTLVGFEDTWDEIDDDPFDCDPNFLLSLAKKGLFCITNIEDNVDSCD